MDETGKKMKVEIFEEGQGNQKEWWRALNGDVRVERDSQYSLFPVNPLCGSVGPDQVG